MRTIRASPTSTMATGWKAARPSSNNSGAMQLINYRRRRARLAAVSSPQRLPQPAGTDTYSVGADSIAPAVGGMVAVPVHECPRIGTATISAASSRGSQSQRARNYVSPRDCPALIRPSWLSGRVSGGAGLGCRTLGGGLSAKIRACLSAPAIARARSLPTCRSFRLPGASCKVFARRTAHSPAGRRNEELHLNSPLIRRRRRLPAAQGS